MSQASRLDARAFLIPHYTELYRPKVAVKSIMRLVFSNSDPPSRLACRDQIRCLCPWIERRGSVMAALNKVGSQAYCGCSGPWIEKQHAEVLSHSAVDLQASKREAR